MTATITARKVERPKDFIWFDGNNAGEVAQWLFDQGFGGAQVYFKTEGLELYIHGNRRIIPQREPGLWIDNRGEWYRKSDIDNHYEVLKATGV